MRGSTTMAALALTGVSVAALLTACAVGPSTHIETPAYPVSVRTDSAMSSAARAFLDSLAKARAAGAEPSGNVVRRPEAARRADTTERTLPAPLLIDTTRELAWLDVLRDTELVALVDTAVANNRDLRVAQARVREFRALYGVARGPLFPQL